MEEEGGWCVVVAEEDPCTRVRWRGARVAKHVEGKSVVVAAFQLIYANARA